MTADHANVIVVGAGFAGLSAARDLARRGHDVVVFKAATGSAAVRRQRRLPACPSISAAPSSGPTQDEVLKLAADLGCEMTPTFNDGTNLIRWRGRVRPYRGTIPRLSIPELLDIGRVRWQFARLGRGVSVPAPCIARRPQRLDSQSLGGWLRSIRASSSTRDLMAIVSG